MTDNMRKLIDDIKNIGVSKLLDQDIVEKYQGKWELIYFLKEGKALDHDERFETKQEAIKFGNDLFTNTDAPDGYQWVLYFEKYGSFPLSDFTHYIPMPVKTQ